MAFEFHKTHIEGLFEITPKVFGDRRGFFLESYSKRDFEQAGIKAEFVQDNMSSSSQGVLRGLHFQKRHPQAKLVSVVYGQVYDVAVDLRNGSATFGSYHGLLLDGEKHNAFYIPAGFAHGFCVISETAVFAYKCTDFYHPEDEGGLIWNDPAIAIDWDKY
ncbi:MAG: dTDP-4-dehydrorhamnose 3,5-epimerase, partial [Treponema sp.]|nr:dTDP-4-dehydrorhamnose 3,5-epimerase [Treponema sp.]